VPNRANVGGVVERVAMARVDVPPVMRIAAVTVGIAWSWQRKQTKKHKRGKTFHGKPISVFAKVIVLS
jgi:hypothetical protein